MRRFLRRIKKAAVLTEELKHLQEQENALSVQMETTAVRLTERQDAALQEEKWRQAGKRIFTAAEKLDGSGESVEGEAGGVSKKSGNQK